MTVKPQIYNEYSEEKTELAEKILLEVWACLGEFRKDMVLVGGLVPRYLVRSFSKGREIPVHCGTFDWDPAKLAKTVREDEIKSEFWDEAVKSLRNHFESIGHTGPTRYASFLGDKTHAAQAFAAVRGFLKGLKQLG